MNMDLQSVEDFDFENPNRPKNGDTSKQTVTTVDNAFLKQTTCENVRTENGAISNSSTGSALVDQFAVRGSSRNRSLDEVFADCRALSLEDGFKFALYIRAISRKTKAGEVEAKTLGQGNRDESLKRMLYYAYFEPATFEANLWMLPVIGRFKDLVDLYVLDNLSGNVGSIDVKVLVREFLRGLNTENQRDLALKYLPPVRAVSKCKTQRALLRNQFAKLVRDALSLSDKQYRNLKSSGSAHEWQQAISRSEYNNINWDRVSGMALSQLATSKFLPNQNLEGVFEEWLDAKESVNYNGYVYDLGRKPRTNRIQRKTLNKQFQSLVGFGESNGAIQGNVWTAIDTSGSMTYPINGTNGLTAYDVCVSLGVYFSTLNQGAFHKNVIMFDDTSKVKQLSGEFCDMYDQIAKDNTAWGSTNFQSVIDEIVRIRQSNPNIPLEDYPKTLLVVSDMQFDPSDDWNYYDIINPIDSVKEQTNYKAAMNKLRAVFPTDWVNQFSIVWWNVVDRLEGKQDFPSTLDDASTYMFSGFDGSIVSFLLGGTEQDEGETRKVPTMEEILEQAFSQEIFTHLNFPA